MPCGGHGRLRLWTSVALLVLLALVLAEPQILLLNPLSNLTNGTWLVDFTTHGQANINFSLPGRLCCAENESPFSNYTCMSNSSFVTEVGYGSHILSITFGNASTTAEAVYPEPGFTLPEGPANFTEANETNQTDNTTLLDENQTEPQCSLDTDCEDDNTCTDDSCLNGTCFYANNTAACDDGLFCTVNDTCSDGACSGLPRTCDDGNSSTNDSCNEEAGTCENVLVAASQCLNDSDCSDENVCTGDSCLNGTCLYVNNTAACDDGLFCTINDTCSDGICSGLSRDCANQTYCNETLGACSPLTKLLNALGDEMPFSIMETMSYLGSTIAPIWNNLTEQSTHGLRTLAPILYMTFDHAPETPLGTGSCFGTPTTDCYGAYDSDEAACSAYDFHGRSCSWGDGRCWDEDGLDCYQPSGGCTAVPGCYLPQLLPYVQDDGLYGYYGMNMDATWDSTGDRNNNGAFTFDGSNGNIYVNGPTLTGSRTIIAWVYPRPDDEETGELYSGMPLFSDLGDTIVFAIAGCLFACDMDDYELYLYQSGQSYGGDITLSPNSWNHVALVYDVQNGGKLSFYVNGTAGPVLSRTMSSISGFHIGGLLKSISGMRDSLRGSMDDMMVFNRALSASEIQAIYQQGASYAGKYAKRGNYTSQVSHNSTSAYWNVSLSLANSTGQGDSSLPAYSNLVSYWKLDGSYLDSKGSNPGSCTSGHCPNNASGLSSPDMYFDGGDYVNIPSSTSLNPSVVTVAAWVKNLDSSRPNNLGEFLTKRGGAYDAGAWNLYTLSDYGDPITASLYHYNCDSSRVQLTSSVYPSYNVWHHVAFTVNSVGVAKFYVDGRLRDTDYAGSCTGVPLIQCVNYTTEEECTSYSDHNQGCTWEGSCVNDSGLDCPSQHIYGQDSCLDVPGCAWHPGLCTSRTDPIRIGVGCCSRYLKGEVDEILLYNTALSASQIDQLYKRGLSQHAKTNVSVRTRTANTYNTTDSRLVAFWPFNGNATDIKGGHNGTVINAAYNSSGGIVGGAYKFDGSGDYIRVPESNSLEPRDIAISVWVNPSAYPLSSPYSSTILSKGYNAGYWLKLTSLGIIQFGVQTSTVASTTQAIPLNVWTHIVVVEQYPVDTKIYINGKLERTSSWRLITDSAFDLLIGDIENAVFHEYFNGYIDELHIYNRTLSASEVNSLYQLGPAHITDWSSWSSATTVKDSQNVQSESQGKFLQFKLKFDTDDTDVSAYVLNSTTKSVTSASLSLIVNSARNRTITTTSHIFNITTSINSNCSVWYDSAWHANSTVGTAHTWSKTLSETNHTGVYYRCSSGTQSVSSGTYWLNVDATPPVITVNSARNATIAITSHTFNITLNENGNCSVWYDSTWHANSTVGTRMTWHAELSETNHTGIYYRCQDIYGNTRNGSTYWLNVQPLHSIDNCIQLQAIGSNSTTLGYHYKLTQDIDCSETRTWNPSGDGHLGFEPLGTTSSKFTGLLDGRGYNISNLFINRTSQDNIGLFGYAKTGSRISNVGLINVSVSGNAQVGGLVGYGKGSVINSNATGSVLGNTSTGGLIGSLGAGGSISGSSYTGNVSGNYNIGGLVGYLDSTSSVSDSYSDGIVSAAVDTAGGLVGMSVGSILGSYSAGDVSGSQNSGGLIGYLITGGSVSNSYSTGAVSGTTDTGGLAGYLTLGTFIYRSYSVGAVSGDSNVGGFVGYSEGSIADSYSTGRVSGTSDVGGFVGNKTGGSITNAYWYDNYGDDASDCYSGGNTGCTKKNSTVGRMSYFYNVSNQPMHYPYEDKWKFPPWDSFCNASGFPPLEWQHLTEVSQCINVAPPCPGGMLGDNAEGSPCMITTCTQLEYVSRNLTGYYALANNINCLATRTWHGNKGFKPIGNVSSQFNGTFDGRGYNISKLFISRASEGYVGLFGYTLAGSTVSNVSLINTSILGGDYVGGIVGRGNVSINDSYVIGNVSGTNYVGGLTGYLGAGSSLFRSYSAVDLSGANYVGGLVGYQSSSVINSSYSTGNVSGSDYVGGLIGWQGSSSAVESSYSTGGISGANYVGGLLGLQESSIITNAYWYDWANDDATHCYSSGDSNCTRIDNYAGGIPYFYDVDNPPMNYTEGNVWPFPPWDGFCDRNGYPPLEWQHLTNLSQCSKTSVPCPGGMSGTGDENSPCQIESCDDDPTVPSKYYQLQEDIELASGTCFDIAMDHVNLDCNGHYIDGLSSADVGINITNDNATVRNCLVMNFVQSAINASGGSAYLYNDTLTGSTTGLSVHGNSLTMTASDSNQNGYGVNAVSVSGLTLDGNEMSGNAYYGVTLTGVTSSLVENNNISLNGLGMLMSSCSNVEVSANTITHNSQSGLRVDYGSNDLVRGNRIADNDMEGISLRWTRTNILAYNVVTNNAWGIYLYSSNSTNLTLNTVDSNDRHGIYMDANSHLNRLVHNRVCYNSEISNHYDIRDQDSNTGDDNSCENTSNWNDDGTTGCTSPCYAECYTRGAALTCDSPGNCTCLNSALSDPTCQTVRLTESIVNSSSIACVNNPSLFSDKILDCEQNAITGAGIPSTYAIYALSKTNTTVQNCILTNWSSGIYFAYVDDFRIAQNYISESTGDGVQLYYSDNGTVYGNEIVLSNKGLHLMFSNGSNITANDISSNRKEGVLLESSDNTLLHGNNITLNGRDGLLINSYSNGALVNWNRLCQNKQVGGSYFDIRDQDSGSGDNNTCDYYSNWNDDGESKGCTNLCIPPPPCYLEDAGVCTMQISSCACLTEALNATNCSRVNWPSGSIYASGTCINNPVNFTNKTLDCYGHVITGAWYANNYGLYLNGKSNITINNCRFRNWARGIYLNSVTNSSLTDCVAYSGDTGFYINSSSEVTMVGLSAYSNSREGLSLSHSTDCMLINSTFSSNDYGVLLQTSYSNLLYNNTVTSNDENGIDLRDSNYNDLINNTVTLSRRNGLYFALTSHHNNATSNRLCYNDLAGGYYDISDSDSNSGQDNTCDKFNNWNDLGFSRCSLWCTNNPPVVHSVILNATDSPLNSTFANLTVYYNVTDHNNDPFTIRYTWYKNGVLNSTSIITDGLVAYWPFDHDERDYWGGNDVYDTYGDASLIADGRVGGAYKFGGNGGYLDLDGPAELAPTSALTISAWINANSTQGTDPRILANSVEYDGYDLYLNSSVGYVPNFVVKETGYAWGDCKAAGTTGLNDSQWHHVIGIYNGTNLYVYVDDVLVGSDTCRNAGVGYQWSSMFIGTKSYFPYYFNGSIDEVMLWNRQLNSSEIGLLYEGSRYGGDVIPSEKTYFGDVWIAEIEAGDYGMWGEPMNSSGLRVTFLLTDCLNITEPGPYVLGDNISASGTCFNVGSDNVTINCGGMTITGALDGYGFNLTNVLDVTIKDCRITNFTRAISADSVDRGIFDGNVLFNNSGDYPGMYLFDSENGTLTDSVFMDNNGTANAGIYLKGGSGNALSNLVFNGTVLDAPGNAFGGIVGLNGSDGNSLELLQVLDSQIRVDGTLHGGLIGLYDSDDTIISSVEVTNSTMSLGSLKGGAAVGAEASDSNSISSVDVSQLNLSVTNYVYGGGAVGLSESYNNTLSTVNVSDSSVASSSILGAGILGMYLSNSNNVSNATLQNSALSTDYLWGGGVVGLYTSNNNSFDQITIGDGSISSDFTEGGGVLGLFGSSSQSFRFVDVGGVTSTDGKCIGLDSDSDNNDFRNNTLNNCDYSVYIKSGTGNTFYHNYFYAGVRGYAVSETEGNVFSRLVGLAYQGNYWGDILSLSIYDDDGDGYGETGVQYPYNRTNGANVSANINDDGPITAKSSVVSCGQTLLLNTDLTANITCPGDVFYIGADNIQLDCRGYYLNGSGYGIGITAASRRNITIKNCIITGFAGAIYLTGTNGSTFDNNTLISNHGNYPAIRMYNGVQNTVSDSRFVLNNATSSYATSSVVNLDQSSYNALTRNTFSQNRKTNTYLFNGGILSLVNSPWNVISDSSFTNNTVSASSPTSQLNGGGIVGLSTSNYNTLENLQFSNNTVSTNRVSGGGTVGLYQAQHSSLDNLSMSGDTFSASYLEGGTSLGLHASVYNSVSNLSVRNSSSYVSQSTSGGILGLESSSSAQIHGVNLAGNSLSGATATGLIGVVSTSSTVLTLANMSNNSVSGGICLGLASSSNDNVMNSTMRDCDYSVYITDGTGNRLYWNNFSAGGVQYAVSPSSNHFNTTVGGVPQGNYWGDILLLDISDTDNDTFGDYGTQYPYSLANGAHVSDNIIDWGPITPDYFDLVPPELWWDWSDINTTSVIRSTYPYVNASESVNCTLHINNGTNLSTSGLNRVNNWSIIDALDGNYTMYATCRDAAGNGANTSSGWWNVVTGAPYMEWTFGYVNYSDYRSDSINISLSTDQTATCILTFGSVDYTMNGSLVSPILQNHWVVIGPTLANGNYTMSAICTNPALMSSSLSAWVNVQRETELRPRPKKVIITEPREVDVPVNLTSDIPTLISLTIVAPEQISISEPGLKMIGVTVKNTGQKELYGVLMSVSQNSSASNISLSKTSLGDLAPNDTATLDVLVSSPKLISSRPETYTITLTGTSSEPAITKRLKTEVLLYPYLASNRSELDSKMEFASELVARNSVCSSLDRNLALVKQTMQRGDYSHSNSALDSLIENCRSLIAESRVVTVGVPPEEPKPFDPMPYFALGAAAATLILMLALRARFLILRRGLRSSQRRRKGGLRSL